jgi:YVTN family beta-propeller protein
VDADKSSGSSTKILAIAIVIALLGVGFGVFEAIQPRVNSSGESTLTSIVAGSTSYVTVAITQATIVTVTVAGGQQQAHVTNVTVGNATSTPEGMAFDPANNEVYVALENSFAVAVINASNDKAITTISLPSGDYPFSVAYDSANGMVYVANINFSCTEPAVPTCAILVIDTKTNTLAPSITTPDTTNAIDVNNSTNTIFASSDDGDEVFIVNGTTNQVTYFLNHNSVPDNAEGLAADSSNNKVVVGNWYDDRAQAQIGIMSASGAGGCLSGTYEGNNNAYCMTSVSGIDGGTVDGIAVDQKTGMIYVANYKGNVVNVISESTGKDVANITAPSAAGVAVDPVSNTVYIASNATSTESLFVVNGSTNSIELTVPIGAGTGPANVIVDDATSTVYVSDANTGTVSAVDLAGLSL